MKFNATQLTCIGQKCALYMATVHAIAWLVAQSMDYIIINKYNQFTTENVELLAKNKNVIIIYFDVKTKIYTVKITVNYLRLVELKNKNQFITINHVCTFKYSYTVLLFTDFV